MSKRELNSVFQSEDENRSPDKINLIMGGRTVQCETDSTIDVANLDYVVGTNGLHGGDAGQGGVAVLTLFGSDGFYMGARYTPETGIVRSLPYQSRLRHAEMLEEDDFSSDSTVSIVVKGDAEIQALADVLIRAGEALNRQIEEIKKAKE